MSKRSERREAERQARKNSAKELKSATETKTMSDLSDAASVPQINRPPSHISPAQLTANQANSQRSTGPITEHGKAISSKNALSHGLTAQNTVLPTEDPAAYSRELESYLDLHKPVTHEEIAQVEIIVDSRWRLTRLRRIETGILRKGCLEFEEKMKDTSPDGRPSSPEVEAYLKYEKSIRNLHIQEARLNRQLQKAQTELTRLQSIRHRQESATAAAKQSAKQSNSTPKDGSVFSPGVTTPSLADSAALHPPQAAR